MIEPKHTSTPTTAAAAPQTRTEAWTQLTSRGRQESAHVSVRDSIAISFLAPFPFTRWSRDMRQVLVLSITPFNDTSHQNYLWRYRCCLWKGLVLPLWVISSQYKLSPSLSYPFCKKAVHGCLPIRSGGGLRVEGQNNPGRAIHNAVDLVILQMLWRDE